MTHWRRWLPLVWSLGLALLLLGPALGPGYVLSYDMVWVPDLALRPDFLGVGSGLPRAVPSDAVVAVLDELIPGMVLQKLVLLGVLVLGGLGAARLTDPTSLGARLVALTIYAWNPFVAERLLIGHWPVLIGYAALPWLVLAAREWRTTGRPPPRIWWLVPLGSLSASAGLVTGVVLVAFAATRSPKRLGLLAGLLLAGNAPWLVSGLLHAGDAATDATGARAFALHGEGTSPAPLAALRLGGIWNAEVVPASQAGLAGWVLVVVLLVLVAAGMRPWARRAGRREVAAFAACWAVGWGIAVLTWAAPGPVGWVVVHVPGAGVLRDGARLLALCAAALVTVAGHGAARVLRNVGSAARPGALVALLLLPVALLPDAAFGLSGGLTPARFPADYGRARELVARAVEPGAPRDVLLLPLSSYRQPAWNHDHKVLDPVGRYLQPDFVAADDLYVSGRKVAGEDGRARAAAAALKEPTSEQRATELAGLGITFVVTDQSAGLIGTPPVAGRVVLDGPHLLVQMLSSTVPRSVPTGWKAAMSIAWLLYGGIAVGGAIAGSVRRVRRARSEPG